MILDTSVAEAALDALLAFSYQPPDTTPLFLGDYRARRHSRRYELMSAMRKLEETVADVSKLEQKVCLLQTRLHTHLATIRGAPSAASALPTELLCEIFKMVAESDGSSKARIVLSHVSRRWREIAIAIPELWTVIETGPGLKWAADMMNVFSRRAGSLELHVSTSRTYRELPAALDHNFMERCTKISLLGDSSYSALRSLLPPGYYGEDVRELVVEAPLHDGINAPVFQLSEELHGCRILHLRGVQLPDDSVSLMLNVLHVENMMIQNFRDVISTSHCTDLTELYIANIVVDEHEDEDFLEDCSEAIVANLAGLKKLKHLGIKGCTPDVLNLILRAWPKPLPRSLDIDPGSLHASPNSVFFTLTLLELLVNRSSKLESFKLSGPVEWLIGVGSLVRTASATSLPSLLHLTVRAYAWAGEPMDPPDGTECYIDWCLDFLSKRSSASLPRLESLAVSGWIVDGYEDRIREFVGELTILPST